MISEGSVRSTVLLTGGSGFLGRHLTLALLARGDRVVSVVRDSSVSLPEGVERVVWDGDARALKDEVARWQPDVAVHLAAVSLGDHRAEDIDRMLDASLRLGTQLIDALSQTACRGLVCADTFWQHDPSPGVPVASSLYAAFKSAFDPIAAFFSLKRGFTTVSLELFDVYGPDDHRTRLVDTLVRLSPADSLDVSPGMQVMDLVHVDDVVSAFVIAADAVLAGSMEGTPRYAVSGGDRRTLRDVVALVEQIRGIQIDVRWGARDYRECDVLDPCSACPPLPGWTPRVSLADGIRALLT